MESQRYDTDQDLLDAVNQRDEEKQLNDLIHTIRVACSGVCWVVGVAKREYRVEDDGEGAEKEARKEERLKQVYSKYNDDV
jgi:hypothetical protein